MCKTGAAMPTNLAIDDNLIEQAKIIGGHKTKKAVVTEALEEYIQRRKQLQILKLTGKFKYDEMYNYKALRKRNRRSWSTPACGPSFCEKRPTIAIQ
jgi:Arc/MetJ family transcription regulator